MRFYGSLFLLLTMFARAQKFDDKEDDNPSPSDILEGKVNFTSSSTSSVTSSVTDDDTLKSDGVNNVLNGMGVLAMMLFL